MESVVFDGKEFVKASVLAEKFRYTQDYLGQLCRGKKVDARLVGRAWYINLDSLNSHRTARYKTVSKPEVQVTKKTSNHYLSRIDVEPVLKQKTVKILKGERGALTEVAMKYEGDDYSLIPRVNKSAISSYLHIEPAEAEKVKVHKDKDVKNVTNFKAEPLPEVYLSGTLKVEGIEEATSETPSEAIREHPIESVVVTPAIASTPKTPLNPIKIRTLTRAPIHQTAPVINTTAVPSLIKKPAIATSLQRPTLIAAKANHPPHTFTPATLTVAKKPIVESNKHSVLLPVLSVLTAFVTGFFVLTTELHVEASAGSYVDTFVIKLEHAQHIAEVIRAKMF